MEVLKVTVNKKPVWTRLGMPVPVELSHTALLYRYGHIWLSQANLGPWVHALYK